ncbi:hypothetical protein [Streptomyces sp. NPDC056405]|uniref:hypothetical protein n=1 Tax=Streptomyces sp. NPDC056405 TaxID=3345811 RepID=UPI0035D872B1
MIGRMDLQGVGAVGGAGVAAAGVIGAVLVGRWNLKAVNKTADAGMAQADASYRAALDAVQTQGENERLQWKRTVQRETYATFLNSLMTLTEHATELMRVDILDWAGFQQQATTHRPLEAEVRHKLLLVKLEGPEAVAAAAQRLHDRARERSDTMAENFRWHHAHRLIETKRASHSDQFRRVQQLLPEARARYSSLNTAEPDDPVMSVLSELRSLLAGMELPVYHLPALCQESPYESLGITRQNLDEQIEEFLTAAREAINPAMPSVGT